MRSSSRKIKIYLFSLLTEYVISGSAQHAWDCDLFTVHLSTLEYSHKYCRDAL